MKKTLLFFIVFLPLISFAQKTYFGAGFDYNYSNNPGATYSFGIREEIQIKESNWYMTWHYSVGTTTNADDYYRSSLLLRLYGSPAYWDQGSHPSFGGAIALAIFPIACPTGVVNYFYTSPSEKYRMGVYANLFESDYWDVNNKIIDAWSPEIGYKMYCNLKGHTSLFFSVGASFTNNMLSYRGAEDSNLPHFNASFGIVNRKTKAESVFAD